MLGRGFWQRHVLFVARTTVSSRKDAQDLASRLIDARVAVCTHITEVSSQYDWQGTREQETEFMVEARTTLPRRSVLLEAMRQGHPYEVPLVEGWRVHNVPSNYMAWAHEQVRRAVQT